jgi:hypothetical protein
LSSDGPRACNGRFGRAAFILARRYHLRTAVVPILVLWSSQSWSRNNFALVRGFNPTLKLSHQPFQDEASPNAHGNLQGEGPSLRIKGSHAVGFVLPVRTSF